MYQQKVSRGNFKDKHIHCVQGCHVSGKCQGKAKFSPGQGKVREFLLFDPCQGIVREFCCDILF